MTIHDMRIFFSEGFVFGKILGYCAENNFDETFLYVYVMFTRVKLSFKNFLFFLPWKRGKK